MMPSAGPADPSRPPPTVFLSYASEDRPAAKAVRDALGAAGLEVWYDESGLDGGDAWDQKIRRQIRECDFFMPLISARTEVRPEGYFRREWRLAVERTLDMADDHTFLLPVVIDETLQAGARVPEKFLQVQWLRLPDGRPNAALEALCRRLLSGQSVAPQATRKTPEQPGRPLPQSLGRAYPEFPRVEPGQKMRFWFQVAGWALQSAWLTFQRIPKWIRILVYVWIAVVVLSRGCSLAEPEHRSARISPADAAKLKQISENYQGSLNKDDVVRLGTEIAREFAGQAGGQAAATNALLAIPFTVPPGDPAVQRLADSTFAQLYGRVAIAHHGQVGLADSPLSSPDASAALTRGRAERSKYVLYGGVDLRSATPSLTVKLIAVADGSTLWSKSYPVAGADPAGIAADVAASVPNLDGD
ncbi:MAG TPA: toll/interleukin-1 receptor domain-containing protein [Steroidobacteraceae bacterium]|nr:toll/interleukin-1 receptor domain-containing protein [Steroidobacteraceae bacterium]